jgi:hypothetical protein
MRLQPAVKRALGIYQFVASDQFVAPQTNAIEIVGGTYSTSNTPPDRDLGVDSSSGQLTVLLVEMPHSKNYLRALINKVSS